MASLHFIRRKHVKKRVIKTFAQNKKIKKLDNKNSTHLQSKLRKMEEIQALMEKQHKDLLRININMSREFRHMDGKCNYKVTNLMDLVFKLLSNRNSGVIDTCRTILTGLIPDEEEITPDILKLFILKMRELSSFEHNKHIDFSDIIDQFIKLYQTIEPVNYSLAGTMDDILSAYNLKNVTFNNNGTKTIASNHITPPGDLLLSSPPIDLSGDKSTDNISLLDFYKRLPGSHGMFNPNAHCTIEEARNEALLNESYIDASLSKEDIDYTNSGAFGA